MDLFDEVRRGLEARRSQWEAIAEAVPCVSLSWIEQVGRGHYKSKPTYDRLNAVAKHLKKLPVDGKRVA